MGALSKEEPPVGCRGSGGVGLFGICGRVAEGLAAAKWATYRGNVSLSRILAKVLKWSTTGWWRNKIAEMMACAPACKLETGGSGVDLETGRT